MQGSVLSPLFFNLFLGETLKSKKLLKQGVIQGKTIALADDLLTQCNNKQHTEQIIGELEELQVQGLHLNKNKSVIIGDYNEIKPKIFCISNI